jgi:uncharacterized membrane protein
LAHNWKFWTGLVLILLALLPSIGIIISPSLVFGGILLVLIAVVGGYLLGGGSGMSKGWKLWAGIILFLLAILPSIGIVLSPGLVFAGPILVIIAAVGGYLLAGRRGR